MNDLLQTYSLLAAGLRADPQFSLASVVTWLDPLWQDADDDWDVPHDEDGIISIALHVTRRAFPDVYVQAVQSIRHGVTYNDLDNLICGAISDHGIPLDNLEVIGFGIPMPAYGAELQEPDFYHTHPDVIPILDCFGISPEPNRYSIDVPDCAYTAGRLIAANLQGHADERYRWVAWSLAWLFSCSGNSSVDFCYEEMAEFQPLSWEPNDLEFAVAIIEEAEEIMSDVLTGTVILNSQPDLLAVLRHNVKRIYKAIDKQKDKHIEPKVRLTWTECDSRSQIAQPPQANHVASRLISTVIATT